MLFLRQSGSYLHLYYYYYYYYYYYCIIIIIYEEVLKDFRSNQEDKLQHHLTSQGFFFSNVIKYSLSSVNSIWSEAQSHLPKNIYNFTIRYINNSLPTRKNMARWGLSQSPDCSFCLNPESLLHVVAGCQQYLDRFTWRHDSILNFIAKSLQPVINVHSSLFALCRC